jgi:hypothetical protein
MPTIINGNPYGFSTVDGLGAGFTDVINLFGFFNTYNSFGASDTVNVWTGGFDTLNMIGTGVTDQINLDGSVYDTINGVGMSNSTFNVTGGGGGNTVNTVNASGLNLVTLGGVDNSIDLNGNATNTVSTGMGVGTVIIDGGGTSDAGWNTTVVLGGSQNRVIGQNGGQDANFNISGGTGQDIVGIGNGVNTVTTAGASNVITVGNNTNTITFTAGSNNTVHIAPGAPANPLVLDTVNLAGTNNTVTAGDENTTASGGTGSDTYMLGNGSDSVSDTGDHASITLGSGNDSVVANGNANTIALGNGADTVTANGNNDTISVGAGSTLGSVSLTAHGNNNTIAVGGSASVAVGAANTPTNDTITLNATNIVSTLDLPGSNNMVMLTNSAGGTINDDATGGGLTLNVLATAGAPHITVNGFENDLTGVLDVNHAIYGSVGAVQAAFTNTNAGLVLPVGAGQILFAGDHVIPANIQIT